MPVFPIPAVLQIRRRPTRPAALLTLLLPLLGAAGSAPCAAALPIEKLRVPPGFRVELLTDAVPNARQMALGRGEDGKEVLYVGSRSAGKVYAVALENGKAQTVRTIASGLEMPSGVAWRGSSVYVAEVSRILRFDLVDGRLGRPAVVTDRLPTESHHGWKFIAFGPDDKLYVPVGAPCNVCEPDQRHGLILRMNADGSGVETVARGVRNSVGFDWHPGDRALWFTDNGRDRLGDDLPGDELNRVARPGQHFGFPYCHQGDLADPEFGARRACSEFTAPALTLGAHVAALGMRFYTGSQFPESYRGSVFIAQHGSWNRSRKSGYVIVRVAVDGQGRAGRAEPFVEGWLQDESAWGRPADVLVMTDGSLLISDDLAGAIYRVRYAP
ncbi:MAG: sorbosone dehydrogenase family protein [Caldimonas sp.]